MAQPHRSLTLVELDARLAVRLQERFADVRVVNADFLAIDFKALIDDSPVKVIGNLPFNVAAAILRKLCDNSRSISRMVLMFQREVAARIRATPGDDAYGALSVFTALYWKIEQHFIVAAGSFHPRPKVDAEVLAFAPHAGAVVCRRMTNATCSRLCARRSPRRARRFATRSATRLESTARERCAHSNGRRSIRGRARRRSACRIF